MTDEKKKEIKLRDVAKTIGKKIKGKLSEREKEDVLNELWELRKKVKNKNIKKVLMSAIEGVENAVED